MYWYFNALWRYSILYIYVFSAENPVQKVYRDGVSATSHFHIFVEDKDKKIFPFLDALSMLEIILTFVLSEYYFVFLLIFHGNHVHDFSSFIRGFSSVDNTLL